MNNAANGGDNVPLIALLPPSYKKYRHIPHKCSTCWNVKCLLKWRVMCWTYCPEWCGGPAAEMEGDVIE